MAKRKRRTKAEILAAESQGLGDTVEKVLEVTGIAKVAKWILGEDCNCDARKAKLNEFWPYRNVKCLEQPEYDWLKEWFDKNTNVVKPSEQKTIMNIHSRVFGVRNEPTSCASCLLHRIEQLKTVFNTYEDANTEAK